MTREARKVFESDYAEGFAQILATAGYSNVPETELAAFQFFVTLAALKLSSARKDANEALQHTVCAVAERQFGPGFKSIISDYARTLRADLGRKTGGNFMPDTMGLALKRMTGRDDQEVVALRLALLAATSGLLRREMEFFNSIDIRI